MKKLEIKKYNTILNREATKISALLSGKIDKYEQLTGEEILPFHQNQIIEKAKFIYFPFREKFLKTCKLNMKLKTSWGFRNFKTCWTMKIKISWRHFSKTSTK